MHVARVRAFSALILLAVLVGLGALVMIHTGLDNVNVGYVKYAQYYITMSTQMV